MATDCDMVRSGVNTLDDGFEVREIVVAQGIERTNSEFDGERTSYLAKGDRKMADFYASFRIPQSLQSKFSDMIIFGNDEAEYKSQAQQVKFKIRVVNTKDAFKKALETPGLHVIYSGHARYGRGPCFGQGAPTVSGEDWEQGTNPMTTGLLRMGFPVIGVHFSEIAKHQYSFYPVPESTEIKDEWRHPELPAKLKAVKIPDNLTAKIFPPGQPDDKYWGFHDREGEGVVLYAGWENTKGQPMDLGATKIKCRCFCCFGCSTFIHWHPILRKRKSWVRTEDDRFAYFTRRPSWPITTPAWIEALFSYPKPNKNQSWYPSLQWSVRRANQLVQARGNSCGII